MSRRALTWIIVLLALSSWVAGPGVISQAQAGQRSAVDQPDDLLDYQIHVMYVLPSDGVDEQLDTNGQIAISVAAFQNWLAGQSGGQRLRLDTYQGKLDITFFRLAQTDGIMAQNGVFVRDAIERALHQAGFNNPKKIYAVYYGGNAPTCGGSAWPPSLIGNVAAEYLKGTPPGAPACSTNLVGASASQPGYFEYAMLHEIFHTLGAVAMCAPNFTQRGHVSDGNTDLMYAGDQPWNPSVLDIGHDDYFGHNNPKCLDIAKSVFLDPISSNAATPTGWSAVKRTCSVKGTTPTNITFTNDSERTLRIYWIDYNCKETFYNTLPPGQSYTQPTFVTHPWSVRDANTDELLRQVVPADTTPLTIRVQ